MQMNKEAKQASISNVKPRSEKPKIPEFSPKSGKISVKDFMVLGFLIRLMPSGLIR